MNKLHSLNSPMIVCSVKNKYMFYPKEENEAIGSKNHILMQIGALKYLANWCTKVSYKL